MRIIPGALLNVALTGAAIVCRPFGPVTFL
jgi:hypothetical protein